MMWCVVCHFIRLHEHDGQGKHKGLMSYNTNAGISALKEHVCFEHSNLYNKWGAFLLYRVANKAQRRKKMFALFRSPNSLVTNAFIAN